MDRIFFVQQILCLVNLKSKKVVKIGFSARNTNLSVSTNYKIFFKNSIGNLLFSTYHKILLGNFSKIWIKYFPFK